MAVHHGKEGEVVVGGPAVGELVSLTLEMHFDEAESVQTQLTAGTSITFKLLPEGSSTGDRKFEGASVITGMSVSQPLDGVVSRSVTFQGTGALTIGTE